MRNWAVASAIGAPVAMIGGWTLAQSRQPPGYDPITQTISALAERDATDRWIMTAGLFLLGVCYIATAAGLPEAGLLGRALLTLGGVAVIAVSFLPQPAYWHPVFAGISFAALALWPAFSLVPGRAARLLATTVLVALMVWFAFQLDGGHYLGLSERFLGAAEAAWPIWVVFAVLAAGSRRAPAEQQSIGGSLAADPAVERRRPSR